MSANAKEESGGILQTMFSPSIGLMNRLRYAWKFVLIGVVVVLPVLVLTKLQFNAATESLVFSAEEESGVDYIRRAKDVLFAIQRRRVLAVAVAAGDAASRGDLAAATSDVDARVSEMDAIDGKLGGELRTTSKWNAVKASWAKVRASQAVSPDDVDSGHVEACSLLIDLILNDAGNNSNLILDPDLDSYWLMDAFVIKLPAINDTLATIATRAMRPSADPLEKIVDLAGQSRLLVSATSDLVNTDMKTAFKESTNPKYGMSPTLVSALEPPTKTASDADSAFADFIKSTTLVLGAAPAKDAPPAARTSPHQIAEQALRAMRENGALYEKVAPELRWLCHKRVEKYSAQRNTGLILIGIAVFALSYLLIGFYFSVRLSVRALAGATSRMISGTSETFVLPSRDEIGDIAGSYNQINTALLESRELQRRVAAENDELQANIMDLLQVVATASDGDLRVRAKITAGALGNVADAFNQLLEAFQNLMSQIQKQITSTSKSIGEISLVSESMALEATKQTQEILAATGLVEKLSGEIARVSDNAQSAANAAKRAEVSASEGVDGVQSVIQGMGNLRANVQAGAKKIKALGDRSMEITGIVGTIARISEQTNMLALNAAIEAARAGEHGRGFSVVAEEVRKLAERTATATEEIDKLVKAIHNETNETVVAVEKQTQVVEHESQLVGRAGDSLTKIREVSTESAKLIAEISEFAKGQASETMVIVGTMGNVTAIARTTQENANGTVGTIKRLISLSDELTKSMNRFRVA
jgi:methyl-accepting chemotaxis protein